MVNEQDQKRPYAATANITAVIERVRTRNLPDVIDDDFLRIVGMGDAVFGRVKFALQFLNLTRGDGSSTDTLRALSKAPEQEYRQLLEATVRNAYAEDLVAVDPAQDSQNQIIEAFRKYEPRSQTSRMVMLFLGLCREAGIQVKDAPRERRMQGTVKRSVQTKAQTGGRREARQSRTPPTPPLDGGLFGLTEDDVANLDDAEFQQVWAALGKIAAAKMRAKKRAREWEVIPSHTNSANDGNDEGDGPIPA